jgi:aerobic-type carbon monoxide dehydrogenase small subunit (CoxS/CutS family)
MPASVAFRLNGTPVTVARDDDTPLLHALRADLGLMGTRFGCGQESCGACMVSVDGAARYACTLPLAAVADRDVTTADGLSGHPVGQALLAAFRAEQAGQCGYCLNGILMSAFTLLRSGPPPDRATIIAALDPHLCRCGAHPAIIRAVERAAATLAAGARA